MYHIDTLAKALETVANSESDNYWIDFWYYFGDFLDFFYREDTTNEQRWDLVKDEPEFFNCFENWQYAFLAGAVQHLCVKYSLSSPKWVYDKKYFLEDPYFSLNAKGNLQALLLCESPKEFRIRNIFTSANTLGRC